MNFEIMKLIEFLNIVKSSQKDTDNIERIINIENYKNSLDMMNGEKYLYEILKDDEVRKYLKIRHAQDNFNIYRQPITKQESFIHDCNAVISAISISILEDKTEGKLKDQIRPEFKNLIELIEFYKNVIKQ